LITSEQFSADDILNWYLLKVNPSVDDINCTELKKILAEKSNKRVMVYYGKPDYHDYNNVLLELTEFNEVGEEFDHYHLTDKACAAKYGVQKDPSFILFREHDAKPAVYSKKDISLKDLQQWMITETIPAIVNLSDDNMNLISNSHVPIILFFVSRTTT
jgi:hypothetical protein